MTDSDDDRFAVERMGEGFTADERDAQEALEREVRRRERRQAPAGLHVNVDESLMTSPAGIFSDKDLARMERQHREANERYGRMFRGEPEPG